MPLGTENERIDAVGLKDKQRDNSKEQANGATPPITVKDKK